MTEPIESVVSIPDLRRVDGIPDRRVLRLYGGAWQPLAAPPEISPKVAEARRALMAEAR